MTFTPLDFAYRLGSELKILQVPLRKIERRHIYKTRCYLLFLLTNIKTAIPAMAKMEMAPRSRKATSGKETVDSVEDVGSRIGEFEADGLDVGFSEGVSLGVRVKEGVDEGGDVGGAMGRIIGVMRGWLSWYTIWVLPFCAVQNM
jgi:hypothetical protein